MAGNVLQFESKDQGPEPIAASMEAKLAAAHSELAKLSDSTVRKYSHAWREFCEWHGQPIQRLAGPEFDSMVADYAMYRFDSGKAPKTIYLEVAGIKWFLAELFGVAGPWIKWLRTNRGIQRDGFQRGKGQKDGLNWKQVATLADLAPTVRKGIVGIRDAALVLAMSDGLLRASEATNVDVEHIGVTPNGGSLLIPKSKTDQAGRGAISALRPTTLAAISRWQKVSGIYSGPVFRSIGGPGAREGKRLRPITICEIVKVLTKAAGMEGNYGSHSLRIGSAQELAARGASDIEIMNAGRWSSVEMAAFYARPQRAEQSPMLKYWD